MCNVLPELRFVLSFLCVTGIACSSFAHTSPCLLPACRCPSAGRGQCLALKSQSMFSAASSMARCRGISCCFVTGPACWRDWLLRLCSRCRAGGSFVRGMACRWLELQGGVDCNCWLCGLVHKECLQSAQLCAKLQPGVKLPSCAALWQPFSVQKRKRACSVQMQPHFSTQWYHHSMIAQQC